jgi:hypothetical protein
VNTCIIYDLVVIILAVSLIHFYIIQEPGLEKPMLYCEKPAGRFNTGICTGLSGKTGFLTENVHVWGSRTVTMQPTTLKAA